MTRGGWPSIILAVAAFLGIAALLGFGYRATREWHRSSDLLTARDTREAADVLVRAVSRDMAGMQSRVLANGAWTESLVSLADTSTQVAIAFTHYPYPESFFSWRGTDKRVVFFNRTNRPPAWMPQSPEARRFPVFLVTDPPEAQALQRRIDAYGAAHYDYVAFETDLGGQPYQVIAHLMYTDLLQERPDTVIGFTVNLTWIRDSYLADIFSQVVRLADREQSLEIGVLDDKGQLLWESRMANRS